MSTKEHASRLSNFKIAKMDAGAFFTKTNLTAGRDAAVSIAKIIAKDLGYGIKEDIGIVSCDGNDPVYFNYVYDLKWLD